MTANRRRGDPYRASEHEHARHFDALLSLAVHAALLVAAYYAFSHRPAALAADRQVQATSRAATAAAASRRVNALYEIERALAESAGQQPPPAPTHAATLEATVPEARARYEAIRERDREARAAELAALLDIPLAQARQRTDTEMPALPPLSSTAEGTAAQLAMLEAQARAALARRVDALSRRDAQRAGLSTSGDGGRGAGQAASTLRDALDRFDIVAEPPQRAPLSPSGRASQVPQVDAGPLHTGNGRRIGAGGPYVTRLYVDSWYVLGPFEARGDRPLDHPYPPESGVDLDGSYAGKDGLTLKWRYLQAGRYPTYLPDPAENAIYYGYTELMLDRDRELWAWVGADDDARVWVDDRAVWNGGNGDKPWFYNDARSMTREIAEYNLSEGKVKLRLGAGRHRVLFKLHNGIEVMFFSFVLTDASAPAAGAPSGTTVPPPATAGPIRH
jgi:hypothetical protein